MLPGPAGLHWVDGAGHITGSVPSVPSVTGQMGQVIVGARPVLVFCIPAKSLIMKLTYDETHSTVFYIFFIQFICSVLILYLGCTIVTYSIVRWQLRPMPCLSYYCLYTIIRFRRRNVQYFSFLHRFD